MSLNSLQRPLNQKGMPRGGHTNPKGRPRKEKPGAGPQWEENSEGGRGPWRLWASASCREEPAGEGLTGLEAGPKMISPHLSGPGSKSQGEGCPSLFRARLPLPRPRHAPGLRPPRLQVPVSASHRKCGPARRDVRESAALFSRHQEMVQRTLVPGGRIEAVEAPWL